MFDYVDNVLSDNTHLGTKCQRVCRRNGGFVIWDDVTVNTIHNNIAHCTKNKKKKIWSFVFRSNLYRQIWFLSHFILVY